MIVFICFKKNENDRNQYYNNMNNGIDRYQNFTSLFHPNSMLRTQIIKGWTRY